ncbi:MAG: thioredoxin [Cephaloticoccus sp.]|nr:thioredoxin [Cephaloticoccus sp.]MCF7759230.1 thioredoxin [Cephaloticoccus sp.]
MSKATHQPDERGFITECPQCGRANRLTYERLGQPFRCHDCQTVLAAPDAPVEVEDAASFAALTTRSKLPVLVDFWAPWCGPCKMVAPELVKVAKAGAGRWVVAKVNTEEQPALGAQFGIRSIPTMAVFRAGRELARQSGAMPAAAIQQFVEAAL